MRLSAQAIVNYANTNSWDSANEWTIRAGDPNTLYFQLIDLDSCSGNLRHMTAVGSGNQPASVVVTFPSIDDTQVITCNATVDPNDASIWSISLTNLQIPASGNVFFAVTEGTVTRNFSVLNMLAVEMVNNGCC